MASEPVFTPETILTPNVSEADARRQLSRWTAAGKIVFSFGAVSICWLRRIEKSSRIHKPLFHAYRLTPLAGDQSAFVATPEKALLDLAYLTPQSDTPGYIDQLRLENLETLDTAALMDMARSAGSPRPLRAAEVILERAGRESRRITCDRFGKHPSRML